MELLWTEITGVLMDMSACITLSQVQSHSKSLFHSSQMSELIISAGRSPSDVKETKTIPYKWNNGYK